MKIRLMIQILLLFGTGFLQSQVLHNVTQYNTQAARFGVDDEGHVVAANLRITSDTTDLDDYVSARFAKQSGGMNLTAVSAQVFPNIGIIEHIKDNLFVNTAVATPSLQKSGTTYAADVVHNLTSDGNSPFTMNVTAGLGLSFIITNPNVDFWLVIEDSDGKRSEKLYRAYTSEISAGVVFLKAETLNIYLIPVTTASVTTGFRYGVENRFAVSDLSYGSNITTPLFPALRAYMARKATLAAGSRLNFNTISGNGVISLRIIYEDCTTSYSFDSLTSGSQLAFTPKKSGDYYIILMRNNFSSTSNFSLTYHATLQLQTSFSDWQQSFAIQPIKRGMNLDADNDGQTNLLEYALGGDPTDNTKKGEEPIIAKINNTMEFRVKRPDYVTGVSFNLQSSSSLEDFSAKTLQTRDSFGTDELYFGTDLSTHPKQFYIFGVSSP